MTFYKHFEGRHDLVERGSYETYLELASKLTSAEAEVRQTREGDPPSDLVALFDYVASQRRVLAVLLHGEAGTAFRPTLLALFDRLARERLAVFTASHRARETRSMQDEPGAKSSPDVRRTREDKQAPPDTGASLPESLAGSFSAGAVLSAIEWWLAQPSPPTPHQTATWLGSLVYSGFSSWTRPDGNGPRLRE